MDPNAFTWFLLVALHGAGPPQACCAAPVQIEVPAYDIPDCKAQPPDACTVPAHLLCKAIGDANKNASASVVCMAKPK